MFRRLTAGIAIAAMAAIAAAPAAAQEADHAIHEELERCCGSSRIR